MEQQAPSPAAEPAVKKNKQKPRRWYTPVLDAATRFDDDDAYSYAAALAFYTALSFAPLVIVLMAVLNLFLGAGAEADLIAQIDLFAGPTAANIAKDVFASGEGDTELSSVAGIIGLIGLIFSASAVLYELQGFLNRLWGVKAKPGNGLWRWLRKRLVSMGLVVVIGFLIVVLLAVGTIIQAFMDRAGLGGDGWGWEVLNHGVSIILFFGLFAVMFRYLPDVRVGWRSVWRGALLTAVLFAIGKFAIGVYLLISGVTSSYGAAGSLLAMLIWVYYLVMVVFFGAEMTEVWARLAGHPIATESYAEPVPKAAV